MGCVHLLKLVNDDNNVICFYLSVFVCVCVSLKGVAHTEHG